LLTLVPCGVLHGNGLVQLLDALRVEALRNHALAEALAPEPSELSLHPNSARAARAPFLALRVPLARTGQGALSVHCASPTRDAQQLLPLPLDTYAVPDLQRFFEALGARRKAEEKKAAAEEEEEKDAAPAVVRDARAAKQRAVFEGRFKRMSTTCCPLTPTALGEDLDLPEQLGKLATVYEHLPVIGAHILAIMVQEDVEDGAGAEPSMAATWQPGGWVPALHDLRAVYYGILQAAGAPVAEEDEGGAAAARIPAALRTRAQELAENHAIPAFNDLVAELAAAGLAGDAVEAAIHPGKGLRPSRNERRRRCALPSFATRRRARPSAPRRSSLSSSRRAWQRTR